MRLIVTRPLAQAQRWVHELRGLGLDAQALPLIEIAPLPDTAPLAAAWQRLAQCELVMFVSANAVAQFFAAAPPDTPWPAGLRAGATGPGTEAALRAAGLPPSEIVAPPADAASFDSEALWARLSHENWAGRQVLVVRGEEGRDWFADTLRQHGAEVVFVAAYRRQPPALDTAQQHLLAQALARPAAHLWMFSSSEALGHLRALAPDADWRSSQAIAAHPRIVQAARGLGFGRVEQVPPFAAAVAASVRAWPQGTAGAAPGQGADTIRSPVIETPAPPPAVPNLPTPVMPAAVPSAAPAPGHGRWIAAGAALLAALATAAAVLAWNTQQRVRALEAELVKRQADSGNLAGEARLLARQAESSARETVAKMALLEARVAETSMQRTQLEDLIQSLARSRDENVLADLDAAIRVAQQQAAITGSAEPLVLTLKQADERLARYNQPRLERVRRAVAQDLERTRTAGVTDITVLTIRLDEVIRQVDDLPLLSAPERRGARLAPVATEAAAIAAPASAAASAAVPVEDTWGDRLHRGWAEVGGRFWNEVKSLIRVTRIDQPEAMLVAPEQAFFLRENVKLRLLNARLALLSRQFDTAQLDLRDAQMALDRYFDRNARRVVAASELVRQVTGQARLVTVPRPDATLAAIAAAAANTPAGR